MRAFILLLLLITSVAIAADAKKAPVPTYGQPAKGSIQILALGHGIENPGYYFLSSPSLAAFVEEDKMRISRHVDQVSITRKIGAETYSYRVKLKGLRAEADFILREGDTLSLVTPII